MANIRSLDMLFLDDLFKGDKRKGYDLNFSDATFSQFFAEELNVDIDDPTYAMSGGSKGTYPIVQPSLGCKGCSRQSAHGYRR